MKSENKKPKSKMIKGFSLVEVLIIVVILMLLVSILVPSVNIVRQRAKSSISQARLTLIGTACDLYHNDFGDYPPSFDSADCYIDKPSDPAYGKELIVLLLTGYADDPGNNATPGAPMADDDGKDGFGFRTVFRGPVFGPYNGAEGLPVQGTPPVFLDAFDNQILYYRFDNNTNQYYYAHGPADYDNNGIVDDDDIDNGEAYLNACRDAGKNRLFLLLTPGPNAKWGYHPSSGWKETNDKRFDDVVNFKP